MAEQYQVNRLPMRTELMRTNEFWMFLCTQTTDKSPPLPLRAKSHIQLIAEFGASNYTVGTELVRTALLFAPEIGLANVERHIDFITGVIWGLPYAVIILCHPVHDDHIRDLCPCARDRLLTFLKEILPHAQPIPEGAQAARVLTIDRLEARLKDIDISKYKSHNDEMAACRSLDRFVVKTDRLKLCPGCGRKWHISPCTSSNHFWPDRAVERLVSGRTKPLTMSPAAMEIYIQQNWLCDQLNHHRPWKLMSPTFKPSRVNVWTKSPFGMSITAHIAAQAADGKLIERKTVSAQQSSLGMADSHDQDVEMEREVDRVKFQEFLQAWVMEDWGADSSSRQQDHAETPTNAQDGSDMTMTDPVEEDCKKWRDTWFVNTPSRPESPAREKDGGRRDGQSTQAMSTSDRGLK